MINKEDKVKKPRKEQDLKPRKVRMNNKYFDRTILIQILLKKRVEGSSTITLLDFLDQEYGIGRMTAYALLGEAQTLMLDLGQKDIEKSYQEAIFRLENLYEISDKKQKLEVIKELNKLQGLYKAHKVDVTTNGKDITEVNVNIIYKKDDTQP